MVLIYTTTLNVCLIIFSSTLLYSAKDRSEKNKHYFIYLHTKVTFLPALPILFELSLKFKFNKKTGSSGQRYIIY